MEYKVHSLLCDLKIHSVIWISGKVLKIFCNIGGVDDLKLSHNICGIGDLKLSRNIGGVNDLKLSHKGYKIIWCFK